MIKSNTEKYNKKLILREKCGIFTGKEANAMWGWVGRVERSNGRVDIAAFERYSSKMETSLAQRAVNPFLKTQVVGNLG